MNKNIVLVAGAIILGVLFFLSLSKKNTPEPAVDSVIEEKQVETEEEYTMEYTDEGFSPNELVMPAGTTLTFINNSSLQMWVAGGTHPAHDGDFDALKGYAPGETYTYTFTEPGTYDIHNHLSANHFATLIVE